MSENPANSQSVRRMLNLAAYILVGSAVVGAAGAFVIHRRVRKNQCYLCLQNWSDTLACCDSVSNVILTYIPTLPIQQNTAADGPDASALNEGALEDGSLAGSMLGGVSNRVGMMVGMGAAAAAGAAAMVAGAGRRKSNEDEEDGVRGSVARRMQYLEQGDGGGPPGMMAQSSPAFLSVDPLDGAAAPVESIEMVSDGYEVEGPWRPSAAPYSAAGYTI